MSKVNVTLNVLIKIYVRSVQSYVKCLGTTCLSVRSVHELAGPPVEK